MASARLTDRAMIRVTGPDAQHFLHNLVTTDIEGMPEGEWRQGALLTAQGKVQYAFLIAREDDGFLVDLDSVDSIEFHKRLKFYRLRAKVDFSDLLEVQPVTTWSASAPSGALHDARFGAAPVWRSHDKTIEDDNDQIGWIALRIRHGVAEPHVDYDYGDVFPHDVNFDQTGGLSFKKGCYVGQEVVSRMQHRGTARWRLMVAEAEMAIPSGITLSANAKPVGRIGSVSGVIGLALVRLDRVRDALDSNMPVLAEQSQIRFAFPQTVTYGWPQPVKAG